MDGEQQRCVCHVFPRHGILALFLRVLDAGHHIGCACGIAGDRLSASIGSLSVCCGALGLAGKLDVCLVDLARAFLHKNVYSALLATPAQYRDGS